MTAITETVTRGQATIYVGATSATLPTRADLADLAAGTFTGFTSLGDTTEAVQVSEKPEIVALRTQQKARVIRNDIRGYDTRVKTAVGEMTLDNLVLAFNGTEATGTVKGGAAGAAATRAVVIVGSWWDNEKVLIVIPRANLVSDATIDFDAEKQGTLPVEFQVLYSGSDAVADYTILPPAEA